MSSVYEIVEDNWASDRTDYFIMKDGVIMEPMRLGGVVNNFKTLDEAKNRLDKLKFKPSSKVVHTEEF